MRLEASGSGGGLQRSNMDVEFLPVGSLDGVKEASLSSLVSRFDGWNREAATRRRGVAPALRRELEPRGPASLVQAIDTPLTFSTSAAASAS
jgi:hypothetical protein